MTTLLLLVVALVSLAIGLLTWSAAWLIGSCCLSAVAAWLLFRKSRAQRSRQARSAHLRSRHRAGRSGTLNPASTASPVSPALDLLDSDGVEVWVVDGRPRYHRRRCEFIDGQDSEAIPLSQAAEDGFIACSLCEPTRPGAAQRAG